MADHENDTEMADHEIDKFHKHELMDRLHFISTIYDDLIENHPAAKLLGGRVSDCSAILAELYQAAGQISFEGEGD